MNNQNRQSNNNDGVGVINKDSGRGLPVTNTTTPMPNVKPPKPPDTSSTTQNTNSNRD